MTAKLVLIFPRPHNEAAFERAYKDVHLPFAQEKLKGLNRFVATKVVGSPQGEVRAHRISEAHFSNMEALQRCVDSGACNAVVEHANSISTGGAPIVLICEDENFLFW